MSSYKALFVVVLAAACSEALAQNGLNVAQIVAAKNASLNALLARKNGSVAFMRKNATVYVPYLNPNWNPVAVAQQAAKEIAGYQKAPLNITITGRKLSGLPMNMTGRKLSGLPLNITGRKLSGLPMNMTGRKLMTGINGNSSLIKLAPINITYLHKAMKYPAPLG